MRLEEVILIKKILVLGDTGKMGTALKQVFTKDCCYQVVGKSSIDFNAANFEEVRNLICKTMPDIVVNTIAFTGIDQCEQEPARAFQLNAFLPRLLAQLSNKKSFVLVHFSTDAVFQDAPIGSVYTEQDIPCPLNIYGLSKFGGDCFIQNIASQYIVIRIGILFGATNKTTQFVEKMLKRIQDGQKQLRISADVVSSPCYSLDIAEALKNMLEGSYSSGLYHVVNSGQASLFDLLKEIIENLNIQVEIEKALSSEFPYHEVKNKYTPIRSVKAPSLRPWQDAVKEYCKQINVEGD